MVLLNDYARRRRDTRRGGQSGTGGGLDLRPIGMEEELDRATKHWFDLLWNASYRCGFATSQLAYDEVRRNISGRMLRSQVMIVLWYLLLTTHTLLHIAIASSFVGSIRCAKRIERTESSSCHLVLPSRQFTHRGRSQEFCMGYTTWLCLHCHLQITGGTNRPISQYCILCQAIGDRLSSIVGYGGYARCVWIVLSTVVHVEFWEVSPVYSEHSRMGCSIVSWFGLWMWKTAWKKLPWF